jgi:putative CocE/NonD family hydrolase
MSAAVTLLVWLLAPKPVIAEQDFTKKSDVPVPMSDGANLAADVFLPEGGGPFPVVFARTPYAKSQYASILGEPLARQGYAVVVQDVRGQQASAGAGDFHPIVGEKKDGLDTLNWIAKQPWCNGKIGMWGSSYNAFCGLILTPENHPNLTTVVNISGWSDSSAMVAPGGAMHLMCALPWALSNQILGRGSFADYKWPEVFRKTPVRDIPKSIGIHSPEWEHMLANWDSDLLHEQASVAGRYHEVRIPILHITGWNDFVGRHTLDTYEGVVGARRAKAKAFQKLIVGPWRHDQFWGTGTTVGDEDFGTAAQMGGRRIMELTTRWFDHWLKGIDTGMTKEKPVRLFVMGTNTWREYDAWPPQAVEHQKWYLDSGQSAAGLSGDGRLSIVPPRAEGSDSFVYDPMDPVPTVGGVNFHFFLDNLGIKDQRSVEQRQDVLVYTTPPFDEAVEIIGPLKVVVYASTEGKSTDFTAKLIEVRQDGYARIIEDGIKRGPDAASDISVKVMEPGKVYRFTVDLGATAISVARGHRLRVEISSSNFPKYSRNPNTGEFPEYATEFKKVRQTVYHSPEYPSHVVLPIVSGS